jgi:3-phosphoshikimate 1-carboxyvinyltransferase
MERIAKPLRQMGANIRTREGRPPLEIQGGSLRAIDYALPVASAQVKSAVLLAGLFAQGETIVREPGPARDHTERILKAQGVEVQIDGPVIRLTPPTQSLTPLSLRVPADFSSAAFLMVAGLLVPGSKLTIAQVNTNPTRTGLLDALQAMGANLSLRNQTEQGGEPQADIQVQHSNLKATEIDGPLVVRMIDEFPIFAVAATQADGLTFVRDAAELRVKETDRIAAVVSELSKMGAKLEAHPDGFVVSGPTPLKGGPVNSHADHRLAMALTVAGLIAEGETTVHGTDVIGDSYPGFVTALTALGVEVESR